MTSTLSQRTYTVDEYLAQEIASQDRHEYRNGALVLMPGGTPNHNQITLNLAGSLNFALRRQPYRVFIAAQRLWIPDRRIYTYPDVMVVGQPVELQEGRKDTVTNAIVIAEVLSQSTRSYDKDGKFAAYRSIDSFREYLLIDQYTAHVEHYTKTDGQAWLFREYDGLEATVSLQSFEFSLSLADLYDRVDFALEEVKVESDLEES
ncbi:Uma2 family endonuclease [Phormidium pseudopriestleyi FRX01]|uniref:Uma2 family endonuclease n=1 Tax=Phormidium pseudopriestleyi FRX01 TaxID=1759528 RepID=A0ABS3FNV9_9CYAN|nr:Uma2 family endonuclease [Phormidium pseudopriestleyi]MBO0348805.1 Uma2 family endonuclease [Phormidium pseudopriestleyi FRX01]